MVHACIDGFSRACLYLVCSDNNSAQTVLQNFNDAAERYGVLPTTVRTDHGGENISVWRLMLDNHDSNTANNIISPVLVGSSVHNQRVERFNRDINIHIRQKYGHIFYALESKAILDVTDPRDILALHFVFLPRINRSLNLLKDCHNSHPISTERNKSPNQLLQVTVSHNHDPFAQQNNGRQTVEHLINLNVPPTEPSQPQVMPISNEAFQHLSGIVDPLEDDGQLGMKWYEVVREFVRS